MREIGKYRGTRKDGKGWVYGSLSMGGGCLPNNYDENRTFIEPNEPVLSRIEVIPETVGEFTGLYDKNGVELAAGDKYKWLGWEVRVGKQIRSERIETIRDDTPEHWIEDCHKLWCISTGNSQGTVEVIGNIHESKP